jgi:hypothetical protein
MWTPAEFDAQTNIPCGHRSIAQMSGCPHVYPKLVGVHKLALDWLVVGARRRAVAATWDGRCAAYACETEVWTVSSQVERQHRLVRQ